MHSEWRCTAISAILGQYITDQYDGPVCYLHNKTKHFTSHKNLYVSGTSKVPTDIRQLKEGASTKYY